MYTIAEVAEKFNVSKNTLRYYESEGLVPSISRDQNGIRHYSENDVEILNRIIHMRRLGATVKEAKWFDEELAKDNPNYDAGLSFLDRLNTKLDQKIAEIDQQKEFLRRKIDRIQKNKEEQLSK
ncbi:MerR family transcriptional regulator [Lentilactobacillus sp. SPB1-3]|uniref:MerR family transcriptional regulator n=1 Tax=Lentilactobacillus terminaliae TaxID=3003483 RepID=A0ACD5DDN9_9LACO|nr:MerR family transcriptional regulator [Lentilactobacillus sp. SPB1-3]MCZ0977676.1 MerR family transcriptional regulator [Lentilactobacillus sp. SPB1-3]